VGVATELLGASKAMGEKSRMQVITCSAASVVIASLIALGGCGSKREPSPVSAMASTVEWPRAAPEALGDPAVEARIVELLKQMTLEQKVGQMVQPDIRNVTPDDVRKHRLGSILNGGGAWPGGVKHARVEDWVRLADEFYDASMDTSGGAPAIPIMWGTDAVHGHNNVLGATLFPHNIGLGAMRNAELIERIGEITAVEVAATGIDWTFAPTVAVVRDDRWGRTYEGFSEDPEIVREYAGRMTRGLQGALGSEDFLDATRVLATAKHFIGDGGTDRGVDRGDNLASEAQLLAIHGQGYVTSIAEGVQTVMASYNSWRGWKLHGHEYLITEVLKGKLGFDGLVVSDWDGVDEVQGCTMIKCAQAVNAGIDLFMVPTGWKAFLENTIAQVRSGDIPEARIDDAVTRILRVKLRAGLFEKGRPSARPLANKRELVGAAEHRAVARQAVRESLVLLKNEGRVLPLAPKANVLVAGDGADNLSKQTGGWTLTWQGSENTNADFPGATSIFAGIRDAVAAAGGRATLSIDGAYTVKPDVAIVVFGEAPYAEWFGNIRSIDYQGEDGRDAALLKRFKDAGVPVVAIFLTGRPLWVTPELDASDAFVVAWLPGSEGGGVADVLFRTAQGEVRHDFVGKLSYSWPRGVDEVVVNRNDPDYAPLYPYGFGLTYARGGE
jgi:beta-glucosidase